MAKRKRLEVPSAPISPDLETKQAFSAPRSRMPIADVAGDMAGRAALEEVARAMTEAEAEGRVVKRLKIADVQMHHLSRDRLVLDPDEMASLRASLAERGQQTPIEVLHLSGNTYGLISGLRRLQALRDLGEDSVLAFVRHPDGSREQYRAMIEENEIRVGLSFYERANIARIAVVQGVYPDIRSAIAGLFTHAPPAKRSKISKFVELCEKLGASLHFPTAIPEKVGLALAQALEADPALAGRITRTLKQTPPADAAAERRILDQACKARTPAKNAPETLVQGLKWQARGGKVVLSGARLTPEFIDDLRALIVSHAKKSTHG